VSKIARSGAAVWTMEKMSEKCEETLSRRSSEMEYKG
jgi:hypothetical protein